jgi:hypothetical protein
MPPGRERHPRARTEAGKQTASRNAATHGLAAKEFFLTDADKPAFADLHTSLTRFYQRATDHESALLEARTAPA